MNPIKQIKTGIRLPVHPLLLHWIIVLLLGMHTWIVSAESGPLERPDVVVSTLAGNGVPGSTDGQGTNARFGYPNGIGAGIAGRVFVADGSNNVIRFITPEGWVTTYAGDGVKGYANGSAVSARFNMPLGLYVGPSQDLIIADTENNRIRKISPTYLRSVSTMAGNGEPGYVNGAASVAQFNFPNDLVLDSKGNAYVSEFNNHTIRKITTDGLVTTFAGNGVAGYNDGIGTSAQLYRPAGLAIDHNGVIYVSEWESQRIRKITPDGNVTTMAGGVQGLKDGYYTDARFNQPDGLAVDRNGFVYIADNKNHAIRCMSPEGWVITLAGDGSQGFINGSGLQSRFAYPGGIAIDDTGALFVADTYNFAIRKVLVGPVIHKQPENQKVNEGEVVHLSLSVLSPGLPSYAWYHENIRIENAIESTLDIASAGPSDAGTYYAVVSSFGMVRTSIAATVEVYLSPSIKVQPQSMLSINGTECRFSVEASGAMPLYYQWQHNEQNIVGATNRQYIIDSVSSQDAGFYRVMVANNLGVVTSDIAALTVIFPPAISYHGQDITTDAGKTVQFSITATGTQPIYYKWCKDGVSLVNGDNIHGVTSPTLTINKAWIDNMGSYSVEVHNVAGTTNSLPFYLKVNKGTPTAVDLPVASSISFGVPLKNVTLMGGYVVYDGAWIPGSFSFANQNLVPNAGVSSQEVVFMPNDLNNFKPITLLVNVTVAKATPSISWANPVAITYGTTLGGAQLNAKANINGAYVYSPSAQTKLNAGTNILTVTFVPTDSANYETATKQVAITVSKAMPVVWNWPTAASALAYGQRLGDSLLGGGWEPMPGKFAFVDALVTPDVGAFSYPIVFIPDASTNYNSVAGGNLAITVTKASPSVYWPLASHLNYGQVLSEVVFQGGTATNTYSFEGVAGTFRLVNPTIVPTAGSIFCELCFDPSDKNHYLSVTNEAYAIVVEKTTPTVWEWPTNATPIIYGQRLQDSVLTGGWKPMPGKFVFVDSAIVPNAGIHQFSIAFVPDETSNFNTVEGGALSIIVNKATQTIHFAQLPDRTLGETPFQLDATASSGLPVKFELLSGSAFLTNDMLVVLGTGSVKIRAGQGGDSNYLPADSVDRVFSVMKLMKLHSLECLPDNSVKFKLDLSPDTVFRIEASTNLNDWDPIYTNQATTEVIEWQDTDAANHDRRFYRALKP